MGEENNKTIFCLDDDQDLGELYRIALQLKGFKVEVFTETEAALAALKNETPLLLMTSLMLPNISGYDLIQRVRQQWPNDVLPILVVCRKTFEEMQKEHPEIPDLIEGYLTKPVLPHDLADEVLEVLMNQKK
jgi:DNA-binding response OmpR family regulator